MPFVDPRRIQEGTGGGFGGGRTIGGRVSVSRAKALGSAKPSQRLLLERHAKPAKPGAKSLVKEGGKGYAEQKYSVSVPVSVRWKDGLVHTDRVKGMNVGHALARARDNWPDATVVQGAGKVIKRVLKKK